MFFNYTAYYNKQLILLIYILSCFATRVHAQTEFAYITDPDGYVNVREGEGLKYRVVGRISVGELFWAASKTPNSEWIYVNCMAPISSVKTDEYDLILDGRVLMSGYIHNSRLSRLAAPFKSVDMIFIPKESRYEGLTDSILISFELAPYHRSDSVPHNETWGVDFNAGQPKIMLKGAHLQWGEQSFELNTRGFYEPNIETLQAFYDRTSQTHIITMYNGDGAGYYICAWQLFKNGTTKRYGFRPY